MPQGLNKSQLPLKGPLGPIFNQLSSPLPCICHAWISLILHENLGEDALSHCHTCESEHKRRYPTASSRRLYEMVAVPHLSEYDIPTYQFVNMSIFEGLFCHGEANFKWTVLRTEKNVQRQVLPTARVRLLSIHIYVTAGCFFINKLHFTIVDPLTLKSDEFRISPAASPEI